MLKQRISSLEKEKVILISKQSLDRQRIKDLEEGPPSQENADMEK